MFAPRCIIKTIAIRNQPLHDGAEQANYNVSSQARSTHPKLELLSLVPIVGGAVGAKQTLMALIDIIVGIANTIFLRIGTGVPQIANGLLVFMEGLISVGITIIFFRFSKPFLSPNLLDLFILVHLIGLSVLARIYVLGISLILRVPQKVYYTRMVRRNVHQQAGQVGLYHNGVLVRDHTPPILVDRTTNQWIRTMEALH